MKRYWCPRRVASGVLLLELSLAMFIIAVALIGLMEGYRASTEANTHYDRATRLQMVAEQKVTELSQQSQFKTGSEEGVDQSKYEVHWRITTTETDIPNLFKIDLELSCYSDESHLTVFLRPKKTE
ncbi:MAG: hypothetical protein ABFD69_10440 [Candidatus Sumerlaeia bacterium]